jgi:hypothetical protein
MTAAYAPMPMSRPYREITAAIQQVVMNDFRNS